jgi:hypothetical protein
MEAVVDRHAVTLVERRAPWRPEFGPEWTSSPMARLQWNVSRRDWTLYWRDRNHRWHRYEYSPTTEIAELLEEIARNPTGIRPASSGAERIAGVDSARPSGPHDFSG